MLKSCRAWSAALAAVTLFLAASSARAVDPKYLPSDTEAVISINLKQILESELVKANREALDQLKALAENSSPEFDQAMKVLKQAGFDLFKDLHTITFAGPAGKDPDKALIIVTGKFDQAKILGVVQDLSKQNPDELKIRKAGNQEIIEVTPAGQKTFYASFVNKQVLVASPVMERLNEAVALVGGNKAAALKKEVKSLMAGVNNKQSFVVLATGNAIAKGMEGAPIPNAEAAGQFLDAIKGVTASFSVAKAIDFQLGIATMDAETAQKFSQIGNVVLAGAKEAVKQKAMTDPRLDPAVAVMDTLRITTTGDTIQLRGQITLDVLEKVLPK